MKHLAALALLATFIPSARADHLLTFIPSLEMTEVSDDNVNYSPADPLADRIRRVTPTFALRYESPRWLTRISTAIDSEQYANRPMLDDRRARERGSVSMRYLATPRLTLIIDASYIDTNTLSDLNPDTALNATRRRGRQIGIAPAAAYRFSPLTTITASASSTATNVVNGFGMRAQSQSLALDRRVTPRDLLGITFDRGIVRYTGVAQPVRSIALLMSWTRQLGEHDRLTLLAGPRRIDQRYAADFGASINHRWRASSLAVSLRRTQSTVVGYIGPTQTDSFQTNYSYASKRRVTLFIGPSVYRTTHANLESTVVRLTAGFRYAVTSFLEAEVAYNRDSQNGAIDPLQPIGTFSHSILSIGLKTGWNMRE